MNDFVSCRGQQHICTSLALSRSLVKLILPPISTAPLAGGSLIISHRVNWFVSSVYTHTNSVHRRIKNKIITVLAGFICLFARRHRRRRRSRRSCEALAVVGNTRSPEHRTGKWLISIIRSRTTGDYNTRTRTRFVCSRVPISFIICPTPSPARGTVLFAVKYLFWPLRVSGFFHIYIYMILYTFDFLTTLVLLNPYNHTHTPTHTLCNYVIRTSVGNMRVYIYLLCRYTKETYKYRWRL